MAYGSMRQMRSYADKVFEKDARLGRMTDGRVDPTLPLSAVNRRLLRLRVPALAGKSRRDSSA